MTALCKHSHKLMGISFCIWFFSIIIIPHIIHCLPGEVWGEGGIGPFGRLRIDFSLCKNKKEENHRSEDRRNENEKIKIIN